MKTVKRAALGAAVSLAAYLALSALWALLIVRGTAEERIGGAIVWALACIAAFLGAKAASAGEGDVSAPYAASATAFWCVVLLLGFLANGTLEPGRGASLALAVMTGGALAYLTRGSKTKRKAGRRVRRPHQ